MVLASMDMMSWGVGQVVAKRATDRLGAVTMVLLVSVIDGCLYLLLFVLLAGPMSATWETYAFAVASAVTGMAGYILYYEALLRGNVAVVGTISAGSPIITIAGAVLFLGETPTLNQGLGIVLLVAVILILSYEPIGEEWRIPAAVLLSIGILILWGVWGLLTKVAVNDPGFDSYHIFAFYAITNFVMGPPYYFLRRKRAPAPDPSRAAYATAIVGVLLLIVGIAATTIALSIGDVSLVSAVSGSYPVVTAFVAFLFLKEKVTTMRIMSLAFFIPGIVLVAF